MSSDFVPKQMEENAALYHQRNAVYGDSYKKFGAFAAKLLGKQTFETEDDYNRLGVMIMMLSKLSRYANNFNKGGHPDSLNDLSVYSTMLQELDKEIADRELQNLKLGTS